MTALPFTWPNFEANGNVSPRRFITTVAGTARKAVQATGGTTPILGVSFNKLRYPPNSPADDGYNAIAGEPLSYVGPGSVALVDVGTAVTDLTVPVTADSDGKVVPVTLASTTAVWVAGLPLSLAAAGEQVEVYLLSPFRHHPALA